MTDRVHTIPSNKGLYTIHVPASSEWMMRVAGVQYRPVKGDEPNRFHRFMQRICFGIIWSKEP